jgi:hypothetical protein
VDYLCRSFLLVVLSSAICHGQLPSARCDGIRRRLAECPFLTPAEPEASPSFVSQSASAGGFSSATHPSENSDSKFGAHTVVGLPPAQIEHFHWSRALTESFTFLVIEQAYVVRSDFRWVVSENGIPFNHYWRDYTQSLSEWVHSGWNDGDPPWYGYVGHPIQGSLTGFIQIQNDPRSRGLEFSRSKAYWWSRLKAAAWNAAYSTQWNLGPLSEVTVEKYGSKDRAPFTPQGTFPCTQHCLTGVGQIDIVMTPVAGTGWLIGEDFLDKEVVRRVEASTKNQLLIDSVRCALNPTRAGANMLHGNAPWFRDRDNSDQTKEQKARALSSDSVAGLSAFEGPDMGFPKHGDFFVGYTHIGGSHCENIISGAATACDPTSALSQALAGWNVSLETKYLRYFGAVAEFSQQYGEVMQNNYMVGLRGGAPIARVRPFAQVLFGAVLVRSNNAAAFASDTTFAEDLGVGMDFRMTHRFSWRNQIDMIKTGRNQAGAPIGPTDFQRYNVRISSGLVLGF